MLWWKNNESFEDQGYDSDFEDEGECVDSSSSSICEEISSDMFYDLDLLYFESSMLRNNISLFEYTYGKTEKRHRVTQSCPPRLVNNDFILI